MFQATGSRIHSCSQCCGKGLRLQAAPLSPEEKGFGPKSFIMKRGGVNRSGSHSLQASHKHGPALLGGTQGQAGTRDMAVFTDPQVR